MVLWVRSYRATQLNVNIRINSNVLRLTLFRQLGYLIQSLKNYHVSYIFFKIHVVLNARNTLE
jgi:hypothetical protein